MNKDSRIFYTKPSITNLEVQYATDATVNGWGENCYNYIVKFENLFRDHLGAKFVIATSSCTGALHMGLAGLNIGPGDEVILADTNWPRQYLLIFSPTVGVSILVKLKRLLRLKLRQSLQFIFMEILQIWIAYWQ